MVVEVPAGADAVRSDSLLAVVASQIAGEVDHPRLDKIVRWRLDHRRPFVDRRIVRNDAVDARDVDDRPAPLVHHVGQELLTDRKQTREVATSSLHPHFRVLILKLTHVTVARQGAVDQHVQPAEAVYHCTVQLVDRIGIRQVELHAVRVVSGGAERLGEQLVGVQRTRCRDDRGSGFGERLRNAAAEQRSRAGSDQRNASLQGKPVEDAHG